MAETTTQPVSIATAAWLRCADTQAVLALLNADGGAARIVGGAVRNELIGRPVVDIDIATTLEPAEVMARAEGASFRVIPTGLAHGTVTVVVGHHGFEVTTLREDLETFGRHATVAFTADWEADARRRDFTINALYADAAGTVHDPVGGYPDLVAGRVRFIGDPAARIGEDYLRILRLFRFHAQYGRTGPEAADLAACVRLRAGLATLSRERVHGELMRLLVARGGVATLDLMRGLGLLTLIVPAAPRPAVLSALVALEAALGRTPDRALRLAALAVHDAADAERLAARLALSNAEAKALQSAAIVLAGRPTAAPDEASVRAMVYRLGTTGSERAVLLSAALAAVAADAPDPGTWPGFATWRNALAIAAHHQPLRFPLTGHDVKALGVAAGPEIGRLLGVIEARWIAGDFREDRGALLQSLEREIAQRPGGS
ncbi:MAG: CCA tRNA nucleotidyltransferase [Hyphomicrobiaceae bacterium]